MTQTTARLEIARLMRSWKHIFGQLVLHADKTEKSASHQLTPPVSICR